ncbi:MAG: hypothetical protein ACNS62_21095 [Candidatus Cyclobacteriaceae bacterium M3_2C_046]
MNHFYKFFTITGYSSNFDNQVSTKPIAKEINSSYSDHLSLTRFNLIDKQSIFFTSETFEADDFFDESY